MRIWLGVLWRWLAASAAVTIVIVGIFYFGSRIAGLPYDTHDPSHPKILLTIWFLVFVWAFGAALRSKHGRYRIALVSVVDGISAFDCLYSVIKPQAALRKLAKANA